MKTKSKSYFIVFCFFLLFVLVSNYIWITSYDSIVGCDSQNHLLFSVNFYYELSDVIKDDSIGIIYKIIDSLEVFSKPTMSSTIYWPNGLNFTAFLFYCFLGMSLPVAKMSLFVYLVILLFSTYLIGKNLYSEKTGVFSVIILFFYPLIFQSSRQFQLDFPLTAMVALSLLFLIKTDKFKSLIFSVFFGLSFGWAMLIKGQAVLFIVWPFLVCIVGAVIEFRKDNNSLRIKRTRNLILSLFLLISIFSVWWGGVFKEAIDSLHEHIFSSQKALEGPIAMNDKYSFLSFTFYIRKLFEVLSIPLFSLFLVSFYFFLRKKHKYKSVILSWIIGAFLLFSFIFTIKMPRFLMPICPALALVSGWGVSQIRKKKIALLVLSVILFFGGIQFYCLSFGKRGWRWIDELNDARLFGKTGYHEFGYSNRNLYIKRGIKQIADRIISSTFLDERVNIGSLSLSGARPNTLETVYWLKKEDSSFYVIDLTEMSGEFLDYFDTLDFILVEVPISKADKWLGGKDFRLNFINLHMYKCRSLTLEDRALWARLFDLLEQSESEFQLVGKVFVHQDSVLCLYKRKN